MPRYKLTLEYDGARYFGWQRTAEGPSVQSVLEQALAAAQGGEPVAVIGAGRTDAGVHALGQVAHVDMRRSWRPDRLRDAVNAHLAPGPDAFQAISVLAADEVSDAFHARFDARERLYQYRICDRRAKLALDAGRVWKQHVRLDADTMQEAARHLLGRHDFSTFRDTLCQSPSPVRTLDRLDVMRVAEEVHVWAGARSFLHRQVRSMVGSLVQVGLGRWRPDDLRAALAAADRTRCGRVAPAEGLYLVRVGY
jgi:tRNA pseudouridine38-40 synthase